MLRALLSSPPHPHAENTTTLTTFVQMVLFRRRIHEEHAEERASNEEGLSGGSLELPPRRAWDPPSLEEGPTEVVSACANDFGGRDKDVEKRLTVLVENGEHLAHGEHLQEHCSSRRVVQVSFLSYRCQG